MIAKKTQLLIVAASLLIPFGAQANDIDPAVEFYNAFPVANPVVLDGDLSEWAGGNQLVDPRFSIPKGSGDGGTLVIHESFGGGTWEGPDDQSSILEVGFDADNVYVGVIVIDEYHENAANSAWNGDSLQMHVANAGRDSQVGLYNYALGGVEDALGDIIIMHEAGPGGTDAVVTRVPRVTTYEIMLPRASLGLDELVPGVQFGLGMAINDGDELDPGQKGWVGWGPHAVLFGKTPSETGLVTLVPEPSGIGLSLMAIAAMLLWRRKRQR